MAPHELAERAAAAEQARAALGNDAFRGAAASTASWRYEDLVEHVVTKLGCLIEAQRDG